MDGFLLLEKRDTTLAFGGILTILPFLVKGNWKNLFSEKKHWKSNLQSFETINFTSIPYSKGDMV